MNMDNSLTRIIEKRAKKALLKSNIPRNALVTVVNDGSCEGEVNAYLVKKLAGTAAIREMKSMPKGSAHDFIALPDTADSLAAQFLDSMLNLRKRRIAGNAVRLLKGSLSSEVASYARIKRIKYSKKGKNTSGAALLLEKLEKSCEGTTFALAKASSHLKWQR